MKFILQILLSIITIFFTNISEIISCEIFNVSGLKELVFYQANSKCQQSFISFKSAATKSCRNRQSACTKRIYCQLGNWSIMNGTIFSGSWKMNKLNSPLSNRMYDYIRNRISAHEIFFVILPL
jgi:hypothetical protein